MKSKIFITTILLFLFYCVPTVTGQIGFRAGIGVSDLAFVKNGQSPYLGYEVNSLVHQVPLITFQAGGFGAFALNKRLDFQPELLFVRQGIDYGTNFLYDNVTFKVKINYLQIPLLVRYKIAVKEKRQSGFFIGPYSSLKLKAFRITEIDGVREKSAMSNVKTADFGVIAGFSMDIDLPAGQLVIDFRTGYSLINMMNRMDGYIPWYLGPTKAYVRNVSISMTVGYKFVGLWSNKNEGE